MKKILVFFDHNLVLLSLLILGLAIRIYLISFPAFKIDMDAWVAWSYRLVDIGLSGFYSSQVWTNYTPGYLYLLYLLGGVNSLLSLKIESLIFLIKLVSIGFEFGLVLFIYTKFKSINHNQKIILISLLLFNPAFIFNSTVWGQIDGILTFFLILSVYFLQNKNFQK